MTVLLNHTQSNLVKMKKCFLFILFSILFSCNSSNENIKEIADSKKENNIPFYEINLSDTIEINTPTEFEIKLIYPNQKILSDYFSILILSDSTKVTFENLLERKDHPFEIEELDVNYWKAKRTFTKKGDYILKGGIYVSGLLIIDTEGDSIGISEEKTIIPIKKKIYVK